MNASEVVFQQLLNGSIQYRVPLFQRTYSWGEDQWEQLWTDILEIYAMEQPKSHFIGAIVTQPMADAPERAAKHLLVDGQQRLTTLCILLACIWKHATEDHAAWPGLADEIMDTCLTNKYAPVAEDRLKIRPTQRDRGPFEAVMEGEVPGGRGRVKAAQAHFLDGMKQGDLEGESLDLRRLKLCITSYLDLVSITLDPEDSPHRIFESLNNTGMRLGSSDLIRNFLFMSIVSEEEQAAAYDEHWYPMQEATGKNLDDFFWRYLMMDGDLLRWDETYVEMKKRLTTEFDGNAVRALTEFSRFARYYRRLGELEPDNPESEFLTQARRLNRWQIDVAYPFLMRAMDWEEDERIGEEEVVEAMRMIESYVVRRTVCNVPTNRLRRIFARMSMFVDPDDLVASAREYLVKNQWPADGEFNEAFVRFRLYVGARLERTNLILRSLETSFGHKEPAEVNKKITVEHVMPRTLTNEWRAMLGDAHAEVHSRWLDTVGNLTLTGYNSELGNDSFGKKKELLADSHFSITADVLGCDKWDEDSIRGRAERLADRALTIWPR